MQRTGASNEVQRDVLCRCNAVASLRRVRKKGKNTGREFYTCARRECKFFQWADQMENLQVPAKTLPRQEAPPLQQQQMWSLNNGALLPDNGTIHTNQHQQPSARDLQGPGQNTLQHHRPPQVGVSNAQFGQNDPQGQPSFCVNNAQRKDSQQTQQQFCWGSGNPGQSPFGTNNARFGMNNVDSRQVDQQAWPAFGMNNAQFGQGRSPFDMNNAQPWQIGQPAQPQFGINNAQFGQKGQHGRLPFGMNSAQPWQNGQMDPSQNGMNNLQPKQNGQQGRPPIGLNNATHGQNGQFGSAQFGLNSVHCGQIDQQTEPPFGVNNTQFGHNGQPGRPPCGTQNLQPPVGMNNAQQGQIGPQIGPTFGMNNRRFGQDGLQERLPFADNMQPPNRTNHAPLVQNCLQEQPPFGTNNPPRQNSQERQLPFGANNPSLGQHSQEGRPFFGMVQPQAGQNNQHERQGYALNNAKAGPSGKSELCALTTNNRLPEMQKQPPFGISNPESGQIGQQGREPCGVINPQLGQIGQQMGPPLGVNNPQFGQISQQERPPGGVNNPRLGQTSQQGQPACGVNNTQFGQIGQQGGPAVGVNDPNSGQISQHGRPPLSGVHNPQHGQTGQQGRPPCGVNITQFGQVSQQVQPPFDFDNQKSGQMGQQRQPPYGINNTYPEQTTQQKKPEFEISIPLADQRSYHEQPQFDTNAQSGRVGQHGEQAPSKLNSACQGQSSSPGRRLNNAYLAQLDQADNSHVNISHAQARQKGPQGEVSSGTDYVLVQQDEQIEQPSAGLSDANLGRNVQVQMQPPQTDNAQVQQKQAPFGTSDVQHGRNGQDGQPLLRTNESQTKQNGQGEQPPLPVYELHTELSDQQGQLPLGMNESQAGRNFLGRPPICVSALLPEQDGKQEQPSGEYSEQSGLGPRQVGCDQSGRDKVEETKSGPQKANQHEEDGPQQSFSMRLAESTSQHGNGEGTSHGDQPNNAVRCQQNATGSGFYHVSSGPQPNQLAHCQPMERQATQQQGPRQRPLHHYLQESQHHDAQLGAPLHGPLPCPQQEFEQEPQNLGQDPQFAGPLHGPQPCPQQGSEQRLQKSKQGPQSEHQDSQQGKPQQGPQSCFLHEPQNERHDVQQGGPQQGPQAFPRQASKQGLQKSEQELQQEFELRRQNQACDRGSPGASEPLQSGSELFAVSHKGPESNKPMEIQDLNNTFVKEGKPSECNPAYTETLKNGKRRAERDEMKKSPFGAQCDGESSTLMEEADSTPARHSLPISQLRVRPIRNSKVKATAALAPPLDSEMDCLDSSILAASTERASALRHSFPGESHSGQPILTLSAPTLNAPELGRVIPPVQANDSGGNVLPQVAEKLQLVAPFSPRSVSENHTDLILPRNESRIAFRSETQGDSDGVRPEPKEPLIDNHSDRNRLTSSKLPRVLGSTEQSGTHIPAAEVAPVLGTRRLAHGPSSVPRSGHDASLLRAATISAATLREIYDARELKCFCGMPPGVFFLQGFSDKLECEYFMACYAAPNERCRFFRWCCRDGIGSTKYEDINPFDDRVGYHGCLLCREFGHMAQECSRTTPCYDGNSHCVRCNEQGHAEHFCAEIERHCTACATAGIYALHAAKYCPFPRKKCMYCGKSGKWMLEYCAKECLAANADGVYPCALCGETDHWLPECWMFASRVPSMLKDFVTNPLIVGPKTYMHWDDDDHHASALVN